MLKHPFPTFIGGRRKGVLAPVGGEAEDPLGLDVESSGGGGFPEEQLQASLYLWSVLESHVTLKEWPSSPS